ncbi:flagellar motor switch phosphatase FliY [Clostridium thermobutyricum]|uniref:Flagellar motor switch protein FliN n=1 Tax=Clostridium thermobutyricum DSM 4928 TaxID=1121339 RepID=A0A1V4SNC2_9CLOT|nr:flagellar motor switch phosphatase FliY [Clostridium thermobutyricum]OPX45344.1 flagellar motor switch protein FliN [Clostridium thermobutyricum DSM 4928]
MSNGFLSQEEIDSLLNGGGSSDKIIGNDLTEIEKDLLGEIGNISMGSASTALYQIIGQSVNITTPVVSMTTLGEIKKNFDTPNVVLDVEYISGIVGRNILIIKTKDAAVISSLMMGGDGTVEEDKILSDLELSAVSEAMNQMIGSSATSMATMFAREVNISPPSCKIWSDERDILTDKIPEDEEIVRVSFKMTIGNLVDSNIMQILPLKTAKKIVSIMTGNEEEYKEEKINTETIVERKNDVIEKEIINKNTSYNDTRLSSGNINVEKVQVHEASFGKLEESKNKSEVPNNIDLILDVPLEISVVLGRTKKSIKDILSLGTGSLIELEKLAEEPVEILVNGKNIAYGEVVVVDENFGVRITSIASSSDRIKSLK